MAVSDLRWRSLAMVANTEISPEQPDGENGGEPTPSRPVVAVRYGEMGFVGEFSCDPKLELSCGAKVVIQTKRGIEIGERVPIACQGCLASVDREQMLKFAEASGEDYYSPECGRILREATADDLAEYDHIMAGALAKRQTCQEFAVECGLEMKVVSCEPLFGGERIILYFVAEGRVDFRTLVRKLAQEFQTRIEMRQVGARDEARLVADYETCGRECCCKNFLKNLKPVSMKMAKMQKATLDPSKVSGRCGRLKCCLRYEHSTYEELDQSLPRVGVKVRSRHGDGTVVARQILTQLVQLETEAGGRMTVGVEDLLKPGEERSDEVPAAPDESTPRDEQERARRPEEERPRRWSKGGHRGARKDAPAEKPETDEAPVPGEAPGEQADTTAGEGKAEGPAAGKRRRRRRSRSKPRNRRGRGKAGDGQDEPKGGGSDGPSGDG
jgi:cell fate regulator YaaT (PSP1 superfamily)